MRDGSATVNLVFQNRNSKKSLAVGMFAQPTMFPPGWLRSTITAGDGTEYSCSTDSITGIQALRAKPSGLTEILPGKEVRVSLKYTPNRRLSEQTKTMKFQAEIVLNSTYSASQYDNYRVDQDVLPPHCKIENLVFDITLNR
jgi:hypothetical protein